MFLSPADVVRQSFRASHPCPASTHYTFQWPPLVEALSLKPLSLHSMYLRAYIIILDRNDISKNQSIKFTLTMSLLSARTLSTAILSGTSPSITTTQEIALDGLSDQWIELDLTEGASGLWSNVKTSNGVKVTVEARVQCNDHFKSPLRLVNPAEIPLENKEQRESSVSTSQPLLLVSARDELATRHNPGHTAKTHTPPASYREDRDKRTADPERCQRHNYTVSFSALGLTHIQLPHSLNVRKCSGLCSDDVLREYRDLGTNHAKTMSSVKRIQENLPELGQMVAPSGPASPPCCVPATFQNDTLLFTLEDGVPSIHYFNDLVIETCGCH